MKLFCSNLKAKKYLKWKPQYTGLSGFKKALNTSIDWYKKNKDLYLSYSKNCLMNNEEIVASEFVKVLKELYKKEYTLT